MNLFLSYRRQDSIDRNTLGRIHDGLKFHAGVDQVFMDSDSISPGGDFRSFIDRSMDNTDAVVSLIGSRWADLNWEGWDDPHDYVTYEIATAFQRGIPVFPAVVGDALMPTVDDLPGPFQGLVGTQCVRIDLGARFDFDLGRLVKDLEAQVREGRGNQSILLPKNSVVMVADCPVSELPPPVDWIEDLRISCDLEFLEVKTVVGGSSKVILECDSEEGACKLVRLHAEGKINDIQGVKVTKIEQVDSVEVESKPQIFISYKRADTAQTAGEVCQSLQDEFGVDNVFVDFKSIEPGQNFKKIIVSHVRGCVLLVALIGERWIEPTEWVILEIEMAMTEEKGLLPVLVGTKTCMPDGERVGELFSGDFLVNAVEYDYCQPNQSKESLNSVLKKMMDEFTG